MLVSPTRASKREWMLSCNIYMSEEPIISLEDIDGFILSQPKHNEDEGGRQASWIEASIGARRSMQKFAYQEDS